MTRSTIALVATAALFQAVNAGVCGTYSLSECESNGCKPSGQRCTQPDACTTRRTIQHHFNGRNYNTGVTVLRKPLDPTVARLCDVEPQCTARYQVDLSREFTSGGPNCNDYGMLPPHGVDQTTCLTMNSTKDHWRQYQNQLRNYVGYPFPQDGLAQSLAAKQGLVTALTADSGNCDGNLHCAFPYGYYSDTIMEKEAICVQVNNAAKKWVEIMAQDKREVDSSYCVKNVNDPRGDGDEGCTAVGDLVFHRESGVEDGEMMNLMFYAKDNNDDTQIPLYWRISASYEPSSNSDPTDNEEKDAEDWAAFRDGAQFPFALKDTYSIGYEEPAVFETTDTSSATTFSSSVVVSMAIAIACAVTLL